MSARLRRRLLWLAGAVVLFLPILDDPPLATGAYVQNVSAHGGVVAMTTAAPEVLGIRVVDESGAVVAAFADRTPRRRHEFAIEGLKAAHVHHFSVHDAAGEAVEHGRFRTAPEDDEAKVRFAVVGDSGGAPWWVWVQRSPLFHLPARWQWFSPRQEVAGIGARIAASHPDFVLHVGDVIYPWGQQAHYSAGFFRPFGAVLREAPMFAVLGNHDRMDDEGRQFLANFVLPTNEVTGDERCWSFAWGAVRVIALDLNVYLESDRLAAGHPTLEFLQRELVRANEPWVVVMSHFPIRSASRQYDRADLMLELLPVLQSHGVDLYLAGHDHTYQRFGDRGDVPLVVSGGGGKSLYEVRLHEQVLVAQSAYHWCNVEVDRSRLVLRAIGLDGSLIDTLIVEHDEETVAKIGRINPARSERIAALVR